MTDQSVSPTVKRAAIYARIAAVQQKSIEAQEADCREYCAQRGYTVVAMYVDKGMSGLRKDRPQYQALLKAASAGEFDVIVAWRADRLYRSIGVAMPLFEMLDRMGGRLAVELVEGNFDREAAVIKVQRTH